MKFNLSPGLSVEEQVVHAGEELGYTPQEAVRNGRILGNKIKAVVILDGYLRFLQDRKARVVLSEADVNLIRQMLHGTNLALSVLRCTPELAVLATDRRSYLEFIQKCRVQTEVGLEDVLGMTSEQLIAIRTIPK